MHKIDSFFKKVREEATDIKPGSMLYEILTAIGRTSSLLKSELEDPFEEGMRLV